MNYSDIKYERRGAAAWITLNRPAELNALSLAIVREMPIALDAAEHDRDVKAIVITGAGRAFCAGADLKFVNELPPERRIAETCDFIAKAASMIDKVEDFPKPVIAAVNGVATAGGMELLLGCDIVFAARSARIGDGHSNYGLVPGAGASVRLPRKVGFNRAMYLFISGELLSAEEMASAGLVNRVVEDDALYDAVDDFVGKIATKSPLGLARMKNMALESFDKSTPNGIAYELMMSELHAHSFDRNEGIAAFSEKRKPQFQGR
ncbi:enoyl-CoA hydratase [Bradyrhizobium brasilense]|uniref:enoyl-CoA hydratase/isomerase family protein n=1 Tax=Bradyrhizobium brasilense TaxID=1419277 RepID=UPI000976B76E|nr:enoyl-CoA hydratase/isomerase family protein [Bradyrhizobium brasilense]OMI04874.1 enoyl-CoA hydratase [Bradyrhizobium brasilense]